jgi:hypothetical protein
MRRAFDAREGAVATRGFSGTSAAFSIRSSRSAAAILFPRCVRAMLLTTRSAPELSILEASFSSSFSRVDGESQGDSPIKKRISTFVSTLFTFCPPGPPLRLVENSSAERGIISPVLSVMKSGLAGMRDFRFSIFDFRFTIEIEIEMEPYGNSLPSITYYYYYFFIIHDNHES